MISLESYSLIKQIGIEVDCWNSNKHDKTLNDLFHKLFLVYYGTISITRQINWHAFILKMEKVIRNIKWTELNKIKQRVLIRPGALLLFADTFWCRKDFPWGWGWLCDLAGVAGLLKGLLEAGVAGLLKGLLDTAGLGGCSSCGWLNRAAMAAMAVPCGGKQTTQCHAGKIKWSWKNAWFGDI